MEQLSSDLRSFVFNNTPSVRFGCGESKQCSEELFSLLGDRIFCISDQGLTDLGLYFPMVEGLRVCGAEVKIFDSVEADPSIKTLNSAVDIGSEYGATGLLGFGGGSSMDIAKLVALLLGSGENLEDAWGVGNAKGPRLPLALVPTTAGTGSEVTPVSIITVGEEEKKGVSSSKILPDIAILDPELTLGLPPHTTATTGIDAMVHAIEAYSSKNANNNPISRLLAVEALRLLGRSIINSVEDGLDIRSRGNMLLGSMFAGMAFANSPVAAVHALAYPIGGIFHVSHGLSNALMLPHVLRFNSVIPKAANDYAFLAPLVFSEIENTSGSQSVASSFIDSLSQLSEKVGLPQRLRDINIPEDACARMAEDAMKQTRLLVNNPRELNEEDALRIYKSAW